MTGKPREQIVAEAAARLAALRQSDHHGDGEVDDVMLAGEVAALFERAIAVPGLSGDALAVLRLRVQSAAFIAVDLVTEDFNRRELLA
jgi:hypothetical protein